MVDISSVVSTPSSSAAENSAFKLSDTFDSFLTLLTAQLTHQDPLEPLDANQFTDQLVNFTNVEQSIATNQNLEQLLALYQSNELSTAVGYIGKAIEAPGNTSVLKDGAAKWAYGVDDGAVKTTIKVLDSTGKTVFSTPGSIAVGRHDFVWDGKTNAGNPLPDGIYALTVSAIDGEGNEVDTAVNLVATVKGVLTENGVNKVDVGGLTVPLDDIVSIKSDA